MQNGFLENWRVQLRKGLLELCILSAIGEEKCYGYDIVRKLKAVEGLVIGEGTIYPILSRFRKQGLVEATLEESPDGPARKYYKLTKFGRECLNEMNAAWTRIEAGVDHLCNGKENTSP